MVMRSFLFILALLLAAPSSAGAQTLTAHATTTTVTGSSTPVLEVSGWIPYWRVSEGIRDARKHLSKIDIIHPFAFSVKADGKLTDLAGLTKSVWTRFFRDARAEGVLVVPTIMWSDTTAIHTLLSDPDKRALHVRRILSMVRNGKYDGVDIDYEGKLAETRDAYSAFLGELAAGLGDKILSCTIEARTPPDSLYAAGKVPAVMNYANDYLKLNEYCDRVNIMAYDQQRADVKLNNARVGSPYYPVADIDWVRKVIMLAKETISADKLVLSAPTYGREVEVVVAPQWYKEYRSLWSVSEEYALDTAEEYDIEPTRNAAGELSFSYVAKSSPFKDTLASNGPSTGTAAATRALDYATRTGETVAVNLVWWSDAVAIAQKAALAKELGVRGMALFKIDGGEDQGIWELFPRRTK